MAIPGPGPAISMTTLNTEFGGGFALSSYYRGGSFVPNTPVNAAIPTSGTIALGNFYGSSKRIPVTLTASGNNYDVYTNRGPTYVAGISDLTVTVPGTIGSTSTGTYAMLVPSAFSPTDTVTIVNNGVIQGMGGAGGNGGPATSIAAFTPGLVGGNALYVNRPTTITNNGTVAGGGGGGGGGRGDTAGSIFVRVAAGGGGGGGGAGTNGGAGGAGGGAGGPFSGPGAPGAPGSSAGGGGGGAGFNATGPGFPFPAVAGPGGAGGGRGAAGAPGVAVPTAPAGGTGGGGGNYIVGNAFVTWPVNGTKQGGAS